MIDIKIVIGLGGFLFGIVLMIVSIYINNCEINKLKELVKQKDEEIEQLEINRDIHMRDRDWKMNDRIKKEIWKRERTKILKMPSTRIIMTFEQLIREGAGVSSIPLLWYRDEILNRCVVSKEM